MFPDVPLPLKINSTKITVPTIYLIIHVEKTFRAMHCRMCVTYFKKNFD